MVRKSVLLIFLAGLAWADTGFKDTIQVTETDGSPKCMAGQIKFGAGQVSCSGQTATVTITGGTGGGGGYNVQPATVTFQLSKGVTASTLTVTSTATIQSLTEGTSNFATQTSSATLSPNAALANNFDIPLASSVTINGPSNGTEFQSVTFRIRQDGATRTVVWSTGTANSFSYSSDIPAINLSNGGSKEDYVRAIYCVGDQRWHVVSVIRGF